MVQLFADLCHTFADVAGELPPDAGVVEPSGGGVMGVYHALLDGAFDNVLRGVEQRLATDLLTKQQQTIHGVKNNRERVCVVCACVCACVFRSTMLRVNYRLPFL